MGDEDQITALREEIRRAGSDTRGVRLCIAGILLVPLGIALLGLLVAQVYSAGAGIADLLSLAAFTATDAAAGCIVAFAFALPAAAVLRFVRRRRIRSRLAAIAPGECAEILRELEQDPLGDTRKIARSLAQSLRLPTELTPAAAPNARGDEATPAESAP